MNWPRPTNVRIIGLARRVLRCSRWADRPIAIRRHRQPLAAAGTVGRHLPVAHERDELLARGAADGPLGQGLAALGARGRAVGVFLLVEDELGPCLDELVAAAGGDAQVLERAV